ncbi:MAG: response regulator [Saprospiraceae bacterium]
MKKILIIEDNLEVRENLAEILELSGYEAIMAENGKVGVQEARLKRPDLILCDVMMPELDGFGVLRILDQNPQTAEIPFIFLTAKTEKEDFRKGMNLGADDYITKPFDDVELLDAIEMRLKKSERIKSSFDGTHNGLNNFISEARGQKELTKLSEDREIQRFHKKDLIYEEGQYAKRLYFIASGKVKTFKTNDVGKEFIIKIHKAGEFLGYQALIKEDKYHESASALEDSEIRLIPKEDFFSLLYNNRDFSVRFIKMLAENMEDQEEQLLSLAYNSIRKRVAEALLVLNERFEKEGISILRDDLAGMVGTAKESVIRTLTDFKNENLIQIEGGTISILQIDKLEMMPN